jgi:DNA-binding phage protein
LFSKLKATLAPELQQLKGLALVALLGLTRDTLKRSIGPGLSPELAGVIDRVTSKLGHEFEVPRQRPT